MITNVCSFIKTSFGPCMSNGWARDAKGTRMPGAIVVGEPIPADGAADNP